MTGRVVLGVAGGIAAYKAVEVCRRLVDAGVHVMPVLTDDAQRFVGALTFSALASEPARTSLFGGPEPIPHTRLGQSADLVVVAPGHGQAHRQVRGGHLRRSAHRDAARDACAGARVPGDAHRDVGARRRCRRTSRRCARRGVHVLEPEAGRLAGGDVGAGRLADPARIVATRARAARRAGPSRSGRARGPAGARDRRRDPRADRSRCATSGNRSSGKMGHAIADVGAPRSVRAVVLVTTVGAAGRPPASRSCAVETARADARRGARPRPTTATS